MPQELQVLRCFACESFQVQIVKKAPKWQCKMCGEKQSVIKIYHKGSGRDCRLYVQQLNKNRIEEKESTMHLQNDNSSLVADKNFLHNSKSCEGSDNKWRDFLQESDTEENKDTDEFNSYSLGSVKRSPENELVSNKIYKKIVFDHSKSNIYGPRRDFEILEENLPEVKSLQPKETNFSKWASFLTEDDIETGNPDKDNNFKIKRNECIVKSSSGQSVSFNNVNIFESEDFEEENDNFFEFK